MKFLILFLIMSVQIIFADELSDAYKKEYTFLKAQKSELQKRLQHEKEAQETEIVQTTHRVQELQNRFVKLSKKSQTLQKQIQKADESLSDKESNTQISASVVMQANSLLQEYGVKLQAKESDINKVMQEAFEKSALLYTKLSSIQKEQGKFYLLDGTTAHGEIIHIGNIATYGVSKDIAGALAPAGNGEYKLWNEDVSSSAKAFAQGKTTKDIKIFIYENLQKDVAYKKEKTLQDTLEGGGSIGYIILALGALGLILILLRIILLLRAKSDVNTITSIVVQKVQEAKADEALEAIKKYKGATARVIKATLRNINKDREHIEDIVTENILNESSNIDRFGNFVLVLAAVAPLLGLLGTVTGMIATFDIITEFGTGDPKLLSGGISEALVTTMEGLIVAIPLLLLGNLLSGWAQSIKDSMEHSALHIVNIFETNKGA